VDETSFVEGVSSFNPIGGALNEVIDSDPTEDQAAAARITPKRAIHVNLRDQSGNELGIPTNPVDVDLDTWLGSTAPTVGQKTMADSVPVVLPSDQIINVSGATGVADKTAFTYGVTDEQPIGGVFQDTAPSLVAGTTGAIRLTANRAIHENLRDSSGNELLGSQVSAGSIPVVIASDQVVPISATSLPLPTGAATSANQTTLGSQTTKINDGTNTATVKAASTAAVTTDTALVVAISPNNTVNVLQAKSSTATRTDVASSASSVTIWAANTSRLGATIYNDSNKILYVKFGTTASTTDFTVLMDAGDYYEVPFSYTGRIDGIWSGANGSARLTELT
jgi:hypothetical protein